MFSIIWILEYALKMICKENYLDNIVKEKLQTEKQIMMFSDLLLPKAKTYESLYIEFVYFNQ